MNFSDPNILILPDDENPQTQQLYQNKTFIILHLSLQIHIGQSIVTGLAFIWISLIKRSKENDYHHMKKWEIFRPVGFIQVQIPFII